MGKALSVLNRQINRFNIENRAHRVLSKEKPSPAPKHPSTKAYIDQFLSETEEVKDQLMLKHKQLDENLKKVYVVSHDISSHDRLKPSDKARLPTNRSSVVESELGYEEPDTVPEGRITLKQALRIFADHQGDSQKYNVTSISSQYKLTEEDTENLLKYFTAFKLHIPEKVAIRAGGNIKAILTSTKVQQKEEEKKVEIQQRSE